MSVPVCWQQVKLGSQIHIRQWTPGQGRSPSNGAALWHRSRKQGGQSLKPQTQRPRRRGMRGSMRPRMKAPGLRLWISAILMLLLAGVFWLILLEALSLHATLQMQSSMHHIVKHNCVKAHLCHLAHVCHQAPVCHVAHLCCCTSGTV